MLRSIALPGLAVLALAALPSDGATQDAEAGQGFYIGLGVGAGSFGAEGSDGREVGPAGHLTAGWTLTPQLLVAGEIAGWTKSEGSTRRSHANASAVVQFYPMIGRGLFVKAGLGGSLLRVSTSGANLSYDAGDGGFGATAGLGYEIPVGSNLSITPYALVAWGNYENTTANHVQGGLGLTWH